MMEWLVLYVVIGLVFHEVGEAQNRSVAGRDDFGTLEVLLAIFAWPVILGIVIHEVCRGR